MFLDLNYLGHLILLARCVLRNYNYALAFFVLENVVNLERILGISFCFDSCFEKFSESVPGSRSDCLGSNYGAHYVWNSTNAKLFLQFHSHSFKSDNFLSKSKSSGIPIEIMHDFNLMSQPIKNDDCQYIVRNYKLINTFEVAALKRERIWKRKEFCSSVYFASTKKCALVPKMWEHPR